jgi:hypothetical protein
VKTRRKIEVKHLFIHAAKVRFNFENKKLARCFLVQKIKTKGIYLPLLPQKNVVFKQWVHQNGLIGKNGRNFFK